MNGKMAVRVGRGLAMLLAALLVIQVAGRLTTDGDSVQRAEGTEGLFAPRVVRLGDTLPNLPLFSIPPAAPDAESTLTLSSVVSEIRGPCLFLLVYSTTCGACRRAAAAWAQAAPEVRSVLDSAVRWVSLPDQAKRIQAFRDEFGLDTRHHVLTSAGAAAAMGVVGTPTVYGVDRDLRVVRMPGAAPMDIIRGQGEGMWEASCRGPAE